MGPIKPALVVCTACLIGIFQVKRRRKELPAPNGEPAIAAAANRESVEAIEPAGALEGPDVANRREPTQQDEGQSTTAVTGRSFLQPLSVRTWQILLLLLTVTGSIFSSTMNGPSMRMDSKPPLVAAIFAMGILHVGALEAFLRASVKKESEHRGPVRLARSAVRALQGRPRTPEEALATLPYTPEEISGFWLKDKQRSDSMTRACDIMKLQGLMRHAVKILKGTRILLTNETFHVAAVSVIPVIKVAERYSLSGEEGKFRRRDQRRGGSWGRVEMTRNGVVFHARWDDPLAGTTTETFRLINPNEMHIVTEMRVGEETCKYTSVFTKQH